MFTSEPIQICTNTSANKSAKVVDWPPHEKVQSNQETVHVSTRRITKKNIMVMHIVKVEKTAIWNIPVHGEDRDGGWKNLAGNQNTPVHGTGKMLRGFVWKLSPRIRSRHVTCWTSPLYNKSLGCFWYNNSRYCRNKFNFCRLLKLWFGNARWKKNPLDGDRNTGFRKLSFLCNSMAAGKFRGLTCS